MGDVVAFTIQTRRVGTGPAPMPHASITYTDVMAKIRALHRVRGFESDQWTRALLEPAYRALLALAEKLAPSRAVFERDLETASRCKAS